MQNSTQITRFNRHEVFTGSQLSMITEVSREIDDHFMDAENLELLEFNMKNQICGLYDGYLYQELRESTKVLPLSTREKIEKLFSIVENSKK